VDSKRELVALKCVFTSKIVMDSTRELVDSYWIPTDSMVRNNQNPNIQYSRKTSQNEIKTTILRFHRPSLMNFL
jgi:hypothetical protein